MLSAYSFLSYLSFYSPILPIILRYTWSNLSVNLCLKGKPPGNKSLSLTPSPSWQINPCTVGCSLLRRPRWYLSDQVNTHGMVPIISCFPGDIISYHSTPRIQNHWFTRVLSTLDVPLRDPWQEGVLWPCTLSLSGSPLGHSLLYTK